jgi:hypothetical protein
MARSRDSRKLRQWQRRMARFRRTQQPVVRFCRSEGVSEPSFYFWRKRLQQAPRLADDADALAAHFTPVRLVSSPTLSVRLPGGTQFDVSASDPQLVQLTLHTLAQIDAQRAAEAKSC